MAFKGDASHVPLTNIFQTLHLNGQEGVLQVYVGRTRRKVRFLKDGVRVVACQRGQFDILRTILVKQKIVTEAQFQNIVSTKGSGVRHPGDFLIQRRIVTPEQALGELRDRLLDLLLEIFAWERARFEFNVDGSADDLELFDPAGIGKQLTFNVNSVLMEVARRQDEWEMIHREIPSEWEVFVPVHPATFNQEKEYDSEIPPERLREVRGLINGERTAQAIIEESTLSGFEAFKTLHLMKTEGEIRALGLGEKRELAEKFRRRFNVKAAVDVYRNILEMNPEDSDTRGKLIALLEKKNDREGLLPHYRYLAEHSLGQNDSLQARTYLARILELAPQDLEAHRKLFLVYARNNRRKEALDIARKIPTLVRDLKEYDAGARSLREILSFYPEEAFLYHELADILLLLGSPDEAIETLKGVTKIYERRRDAGKLRKTVERIVQIDPGSATWRQRLATDQRMMPRRFRDVLPRLLVIVGLVAIAGLCGFWMVSEWTARRAFNTVHAEARRLVARRDFEGARKIYRTFEKLHPFSMLSGRLRREIERVDEQEKEYEWSRERKRQNEMVDYQSRLSQAARYFSEHRYQETLAVLEAIPRERLSATERAAVEERVEWLQGYLGRARKLFQDGERAVEKGDYGEALDNFSRLLRDYRYSPYLERILLPISVESVPPGATISVNGEVKGKAPLRLRYAPTVNLEISGSLPTFGPHVQTYRGPELWMERIFSLVFHLEKKTLWSVNTGGPVEGSPLASRGRVFVGSRSGQVLALDDEEGTRIWRFTTSELGDITSSIRAFGEGIYFGSYDGHVYYLSRSDGSVIRKIPMPGQAPVKSTLSRADSNGIAAVAVPGDHVYGISLLLGKILWSHECEEGTTGSPVLARGVVIFGTQSGRAVGLDVVTGAPRWARSLGKSPLATGGTHEGRFYIGDAHGNLHALEIGDGKVLWSQPVGAPVDSAPETGGGCVVAGTGDGYTYCLDEATGAHRWKAQTGQVSGSPAIYKGRVFAGSGDGCVYCLDITTGKVLWKYRTKRRIRGSPYIRGSRLYIGSDDRHIYAFELLPEPPG